MIITCESCGTRYNVNEDLVKPGGIWARCSTCKNMFLVKPQASGTEGSSVDQTAEESQEWGATYDETDLEETGEATSDAELGTTTDFEDRVAGMIDEFDEGETVDPDTFEETATIDFDELQITGDTVTADALEETDADAGFESETVDEETGWLDDQETAEETVEESTVQETVEDAGDVSAVSELEEADVSPEATGFDDDLLEDDLGIDPDLEEFDLDLKETVEEGGDLTEGSGEQDLLIDDDFEEDFDLDLDDEIEAEAEAEAETEEREFEIDLIEDDTDEAIATEDFSLDLEDDTHAPGETETEGAFAASDDLDQETLDFDLDEIDEEEAGAVSDAADEDFEFDLDFDLEEEKTALTEDETGTGAVEEDEFDLTEVEDFLDMEGDDETREQSREAEEETFELDFETEADTATEAGESRAFDLDLETVRDETEVPEDETMEKFSMETARESREETAPGVAVAPTAAEPAAEAAAAPVDKAPEDVSRRVAPSAVIPEKQEKSKALNIVLILLLVLAIAAAGYFYLQGTRAPEPPETPAPVGVADPDGKLQIAISTPEYMFINNETVGELMVVTGNVTNRYGQARAQIRVKGNIYDGDGALIQSSETVFAGVVLEQDALATLSLSEIMSGLSRPDTEGTVVNPDASMPFMVAFASLPDAAQELNVEVVASSSAENL